MVAVKVGTATACMQMSRPLVQYTPPLSPLSPRRREAAPATATPFSPLSPRRRKTATATAASAATEFDRAVAGRLFLGTGSAGLPRSTRPHGSAQLVRRAFSAESFFPHGDSEGDQDGDMSEKFRPWPSRFEENAGGMTDGSTAEGRSGMPQPSWPSASSSHQGPGPLKKSGSCVDVAPPHWMGIVHDPPSWRPECIHIGLGDDNATRKTRGEESENPPKQQQQQRLQKRDVMDSHKQTTTLSLWGWEEGLKEAGETACCSVRRAFSSVVFIIRELHSHTLLLRELLFYEDLRGILAQAQKETHASFCWLFQQIFSCTPTLMVSLMLLLANYTAHSMALAAAPTILPPNATVTVSVEYDFGSQAEEQGYKVDLSSSLRTFSPINTKGTHSGRTASVNGGGGGNRLRPVAGSTDDWRSPSRQHTKFLPDSGGGGGVMDTPAPAQEDHLNHDERSPDTVSMEDARAWRRTEEEAARMQAATRHEALMDRETLLQLVAPVSVLLESDRHYTEFIRTELGYQEALEREPFNSLLLGNYAQFLFLVVRDYPRAEHYFKRAVSVEPPDAEAMSLYANFLWLAKKDLCAAEEMHQKATDLEPKNPHYVGSYAYFLTSTGSDDLCIPMNQNGGWGEEEEAEG